MKTIFLFTASLILCLPVFASNSNAEIQDSQVLPQIELKDILNNVLDVDENKLVLQLKKKSKVIIMDKSLNKIREAYMEEENLTNQTMLQPFINRSQFITKVHNVSYYMLEKK